MKGDGLRIVVTNDAFVAQRIHEPLYATIEVVYV